MPQLFSDRDIEQLLRGQQPPGRGDLAEVAGLVAQLRADATHEQAPPINEHLRSVLEGRPTDIARAAEKRRLRSARRRWQVASIAAAVMLVGGLVAVIIGRSDDDLTTRPGDKVSVNETAEGDDSSTTEGPGSTDTTPGTVFAPGEDSPGIDRPGSGSSASSTVPSTEATPEDPGSSTTFGTDGGAGNCAAGDDLCWQQVDAGRCADDGMCANIAEDNCDDGDVACWAEVWRNLRDDRGPFSRNDD